MRTLFVSFQKYLHLCEDGRVCSDVVETLLRLFLVTHYGVSSQSSLFSHGISEQFIFFSYPGKKNVLDTKVALTVAFMGQF